MIHAITCVQTVAQQQTKSAAKLKKRRNPAKVYVAFCKQYIGIAFLVSPIQANPSQHKERPNWTDGHRSPVFKYTSLPPSWFLPRIRFTSRARTYYRHRYINHGCAAGRELVRRDRGGRGHHGQLRGARGGVPGRARAPARAVRPPPPARLVARRVPHHPRHLPAAALPAHGPPLAPPLGRRPAGLRVRRAHAHPARRPGPAGRPGVPRLRRQRRRHRARPGCGGRAAAGVGGGVPGAGRVGGGEQRAGRGDEGDQGGGHVPGAGRQDGRRREGQGGGGRRRQEARRGNDDDRGEDVKRRGVPRRQVHHHGGSMDEQAGEDRHRRRPPRAAAAHRDLLLEGEARARARADDGGRLPDVRELRRPLHLQHAVDGVPGADQDRHARRAAVRPGRPGLGRRPGGGRAGGARGAVDRRGDAGPRGDRGRAGDPAAVHVLHDARRGLRDRLPGRRGVREGRGGRRRVLRPRVQDGPGGGEDPGGDGAGRRGADRGGGRRGAPALQHRAVRRQPDGERQEFLSRWMDVWSASIKCGCV